MTRKSLILIAVGLVATVLPALAEQAEVVYFTNGTTMAVDSHAVEEDQIVVSLDGQSYMAFPLNQIEKIETAHGSIAIKQDGVANRIIPSQGQGTPNRRMDRGAWEAPIKVNPNEAGSSVDVDNKGMAVFRPYPNGAPNKARFGVTGRRELRNQVPSRRRADGPIGTTQIGARYVMPPRQKGAPKQQPIGLSEGTAQKKDND
jgi:hypothetical protein